MATAISTLFRSHVVFREGQSLYSLLTGFANRLSGVDPRIVYGLSFAVGFAVRAFPELKYLEMPIGWDTLEYIANARDFAVDPRFLTRYRFFVGWRNLPPLLTWVSGALALLGLDPWYFFKIYPPLVMGLFSMFSAMIAYRYTGSKLVAVLTSMAVAFNPYILGQSQQWQRHILGVLLLLIYIYLCTKRSEPLKRFAVLVLASLSYEPAAVIALLASIVEALLSRDWRSRALFTTASALSLLLLLWYIDFPQRPVASLTPSGGVSIAGNIEYTPASTLKYTIVCILLLAPSLAIATIWRNIDARVKTLLLLLFTIFILPTLSITAPVEQHRWFFILLALLAPLTTAGLAKLSKELLALLTAVVVIVGSAYPFTENGYTHFVIWPTTSTPYAGGYPWKLEPALKNVTDAENAAKIISSVNETVLTGLHYYPQLHLYIRNPVKIRVVGGLGGNPGLITAISFIVKTNTSKLLVVTPFNLTRELEEYRSRPELFNATLKLYIGGNIYIDIDLNRVKCYALYKGATLNVYMVEISGNKHS